MGNLVSDTTVILKKGEGRTIKAGGSWIFDNEIASIKGSFKNGALVNVQDFDGYPMGAGFINQNSKIRVRMLTRSKDAIVDEAFLGNRVQNAWDYRNSIMSTKDMQACRLIFGEADFLPGLVVDRYNDVLVVECLALGMDNLKEIILSKLVDIISSIKQEVKYIFERSDAPVRKKEGLEPVKRLLYRNGNFESVGLANLDDQDREYLSNIEIVENGVHYIVDVINGQKTGFFLDQKYNRLAIQNLCRNFMSTNTSPNSSLIHANTDCENSKSMRVLDCFTHMGTFALNAGLGGATDVTGLDISEYAVEQANANSKRNGLHNTVRFRAANVLDELPKLYEAGEKYDLVILDPPAFTKSREATKNAIKGYREINMKGLKLVNDGGFLATCSCSHFMTQELFTEVIGQAAKAVHKRLRQIEFKTQAPDHPILWAADESYYLKFYVFQVVDEK